MQFDVVIVGGGPVGLAMASTLSGAGLSIAVVERAAQAELATPAFDGREIAMTHLSHEIMERIGAWGLIPEGDISPLREARVLNGGSPFAMRFDPSGRGKEVLGHLAPNHLIRRSLYETANACADVSIFAGVAVTEVRREEAGAEVELADGQVLDAKLVIAADTRFSAIRRAQGIGAEMRDFGKTMMVCRIALEKPHDHVATEWFGYGQTFALLPLNDLPDGRHQASAVVTLTPDAMARLMALDDEALGAELTRRYERRLGRMTVIGSRHCYPLVATYANRFQARRLALIGDAAVGMHPVTAHGFNFGLRGAADLARRIKEQAQHGKDIADPAMLAAWEASHRRATWVLYQATNVTAKLFTDDRPPARLLRDLGLRLGGLLPPVRKTVLAHLMESRRPAAAR
ncbi:5-demethoxyubiquinol-8 5-hydroxylase UbiM [Acetobacteraceae bacterium H6797]|nr:5-demethoxyubiquinol-8 5-hydroxylase UbiM [Acetobacteraceae bacterium H6797]